ncbi:zinc finger protein 658B-like [Lineus longissimus]|uniref:zinc finger protein 658B-like n=1 Tax=Lineus longissimus TaxID=88925 RepID=UPI00315D9723
MAQFVIVKYDLGASIQTCGRKAYPYNCNKCTRNFFTERSLKIHEREIHERKILEHKVPEPKIRERKIGKLKIREPKIRVREIHEGEIHESEINEGEIHEGEIHEGEIHEGEIHEGEIHEGEVHEGEIHESLPDKDAPEFKCGTCANTYSNLQGLQDHVSSSSHEAANIFYACKVCHKKCPGRAELEEHGVSHTTQGQRSRLLKQRLRGFSCRKCSMTCSDMSDLLSHITAEHALAFICHICGERFKKNQEVEAHVTSKHNK